MKHPITAYILKAVAYSFLALTLFLTYVALFQKEWIEAGIVFMEALVKTLGNWNYAIIFFTAAIESFPFIGTAVPGQNILIIVAGFWAADHTLISILCAFFGATIGNASGYFIGKYYGAYLIAEYGLLFGIGNAEQLAMERSLKDKRGYLIALWKFHNFFRAFIPFIAGTANMRPRSFWFWNILGSLVWSISMVYIGILFIAYWQTIVAYMGYFVLGFLLVLLTIGYIVSPASFRQYWSDKKAEMEAIEQKIQKKI